MRTYKVTIPDDKIDFFVKLMDNLGIYSVQDMDQEMHRGKMPVSRSEKSVGATQRKEGELTNDLKSKMATIKGDKSIQDVLNKIEQLRRK